ncbi:MAG: hypothetical protein VX633_12270, partial [Verrucomicrobiota bacterium]|nr:hypothetical protein [Verrucomicrobiota bacterium]
LLNAFLGIVILLGASPLLDFFGRALGEELSSDEKVFVDGLIDAFRTYLSDLALSNWANVVFSLGVSILILGAGIALVKKRKAACEKSNRYVWCSIVAKGVQLILFLSFGLAAERKLNETVESITNAGPARGASAGGISPDQLGEMFSLGAGLVGICLALVYPILTYVMLNKPQVKEFLARNGT